MKRIAIEEHFTTEEHLDTLRLILDKTYPVPAVMEEEKALSYELPFLGAATREKEVKGLLDLGEGRIRDMDAAGIDLQVLSLISPGAQVFDEKKGVSLAEKVNDVLAAAVEAHPDRLAGFASLAPQNPGAAADELERAVKELGFKGALVNSHVKGEYLDEKKYRVLFERAEKLDVPIYIHPRCPSPGMAAPYLKYPMLATAMSGFAAEVSLHALRLICSGLFDEFPNLKIILGHLGEAIPYWLWRLDNMWQRRSHTDKLKKLPSDYFRENFYVTTSGIFSQPPLMCAYLALGADRILFAVDYPLESNEKAVNFMENALISPQDKEKIYHLNAERLLKL